MKVKWGERTVNTQFLSIKTEAKYKRYKQPQKNVCLLMKEKYSAHTRRLIIMTITTTTTGTSAGAHLPLSLVSNPSKLSRCVTPDRRTHTAPRQAPLPPPPPPPSAYFQRGKMSRPGRINHRERHNNNAPGLRVEITAPAWSVLLELAGTQDKFPFPPQPTRILGNVVLVAGATEENDILLCPALYCSRCPE